MPQIYIKDKFTVFETPEEFAEIIGDELGPDAEKYIKTMYSELFAHQDCCRLHCGGDGVQIISEFTRTVQWTGGKVTP